MAESASGLFTEEELRGRFEDLYVDASLFAEKFSARRDATLVVDAPLLYVVIVSAFDDIARYKTYHLPEPNRQRSDAIKRSAYLIKWIRRWKPIKVQLEGNAGVAATLDDDSVLANEAFSIFVASTHLSIDAKREIIFEARAMYELLYDLAYRDLGPDCLMLVLQIISDFASGNRVIS